MRLPDLLPDDPEMAAAIEEALTRTFGDTLATAPEKPAVANKAPRPYRHLTQEEAQSLYDELVEEGKIR